MNVEWKTTPACVLPCTHTLKAACEAAGVALVGKEANRTVGMMSCARIVTPVTNLRCCDDDRAACNFRMRSACEGDRSQNRRDTPLVKALMGCTDCCESMAAEIACAASLGNGFAHRIRPSGLELSWESPNSGNRHSVNHLRVASAFCICVAPYCDIFRENCAIAVY